MFDSLKSGVLSKNIVSPSVVVQPMAKSGPYQQQQQTKSKQFTRQQSSLQQLNHQQSKHHLEASVDVHDTNDIRYSRSNTKVQLQRLSLSASLIDIYFGRHYRSPDVLVVAGLTMILIGLGAILIGVYVYFNEDEFQEMTFLVGFAMAGIGFICCSCRIILFGPPLFNCCLPIKTVNYNRERRPTNPPFFTAASSAMSTVTCIGVRFNSGRSLSGVSHVIHINKDLDGVNKRTEQCEDNHLKEIIVTHGQSLEPIETIKDGTVEYVPSHIRPVNPTVIQYISKLGSKT